MTLIKRGTDATRDWLQEHQQVLAYFTLVTFCVAAAFALQLHTNSEVRRGCERLDQVRAVEWNVLEAARDRLEKSDRPEDVALAMFYDSQLDLLRESATPFLDESLPPKERDAHVDCMVAYPRPWPAELLGLND